MKKLVSIILVLALVASLGCSAFAAPSTDSLNTYTNEKLEKFSLCFDTLMLKLASASEEPIDIVAVSGTIGYDDDSFNYGDNGIGVISGAAYSENGTVMMGMGTGIDENEDYWYASLTFSPEVSTSTLSASCLAFILACGDAGMELDDDPDQYIDAALTIADILFSADEPVAIESNGLVLLHKDLGSGTHLLALDSVEYYDEFYYNDIECYIVAD